MGNRENVIKFKRSWNLNIGVVVFVCIAIYVGVYIVQYITARPVTEYEVSQGTIASNHVYRGVILRDEEVFYAKKDGYINYYVKNASKASAYDIVYTIDTNGTLSDKISSASKDTSLMDKEVFKEVAEKINNFSSSYQGTRFFKNYEIKNDINAQLSQELSMQALGNMQEAIQRAEQNQTFYKHSVEKPGIVLYYVDGYEKASEELLTAKDINAVNYVRQNLDSQTEVKRGDPVFKLVNSEDWSLVLLISEELAKKLEDTTWIKTRFCKDGYTCYATCSIEKREEQYFMTLGYTKAMIRYASERYAEVELILGAKKGLKIPNSSIVEKDFFAIPKNIFYENPADGKLGFSAKRKSENGGSEAEFIVPTVYYETEDSYYIDEESVSKGDLIYGKEDANTYAVGTDMGTLKGVYNINKGFAVFKIINILYENKNYSIVEEKTKYGITLYDHIALEGDKVKENQFTTRT